MKKIFLYIFFFLLNIQSIYAKDKKDEIIDSLSAEFANVNTVQQLDLFMLGTHHLIVKNKLSYNHIMKFYYYCEKNINNKEDNLLFKAKLYSHFGYILRIIYQYPKASISFFLRAIEFAKKSDNQVCLFEIYSHLGRIMYDIDNVQKAEHYLLMANNLKKYVSGKTENRLIINTINNLALIYRKQEKYKEAETYFIELIDFAEITKDSAWIGIGKGNLGRTYQLQNRIAEAIPLLQENMKASLKAHENDNVILAMCRLNEIYLRQNKLLLVKNNLNQCFDLLKNENIVSQNNVISLIETNFSAYSFYLKKKEYEKSLYYFKKHTEYSNLKEKIKERFILEELESQFNYNEAQKELDILQQEYQIQRYTLIIIVLIAIVFSILLFLLYYRFKQNKEISNLLINSNKEITEKQNEIQEQAKKLQELNEIKDRLFSVISHDLQSPLAQIKMSISMQAEGYITSEEFLNLLPEINKNIKCNSDLIENLLYWSKGQLDGIIINKELFNLNELVEEKINLYKNITKNKDIILVNNIPSNCIVYSDKNIIDLILRNLISNSIKFCKQGNYISVYHSYLPNDICIYIKDTGIGIEKNQLQNIFTKKVIVTRGTNHEKGTGLGLILCKEFIEKIGGNISLESEVGSHTIFMFTIPNKE